MTYRKESTPEFPAVKQAREQFARRDQLLIDIELPGRNATLCAAILREINRYSNGCYLSQERFAKMFKVTRRTIQRALARLAELDLLIVQRSHRPSDDGRSRTSNTYSINWTELERRVEPPPTENDASSPRPSGPAPTFQGNANQHDTKPTNATVVPDQCDSYGRPMRQLGPTNATPSCRTIRGLEKSKLINCPLVSRLEEIDGIYNADALITKARSIGLDDVAIAARLDHFHAAPDATVGYLINWLTRPNSFATPAGPESADTGPQLRRDISDELAVERATLIRYGREKGWTSAQLQYAVTRWESEHLPPLETANP